MHENSYLSPEAASSLAMALILSSQAPLLLLDGNLTVQGASSSFCKAFLIDPAKMSGVKLAQLGHGEWNIRQLDSLLMATVSGNAAVDAYEMDLVREGEKPRHLILNAHKLHYSDADNVRIILTVTDVTPARIADKIKDDLIRDKQILLQEM